MTNKPKYIERPANEDDVVSITSFGFFKGKERDKGIVEEHVGEEYILCTNLTEGISIPVEIDSKNIEEQEDDSKNIEEQEEHGEEHGE